MGRSTPRRRRVKQPTGRFARKRSSRNENFRYVNRFGTHAVAAFIGILFIGYVLIFRPPVHVTVSPETGTVFGGVLSGAVLRLLQIRRYRR
ncbi:hypothetical protein ACGFYV_26250 [Streptomyces sp. NPDC048297]|uniref:hypothetical protein n=1 Tax=Streptomyces sp. NPDC048297 TaxID=3365531 RepID=UPI003723018F